MICHVVLFRPRPGLTPADRSALAEAFTAALGDIGSIRRAVVGRRVTHGRGYEQLMRDDFSHAAVLEFDDLEGLRAYLDHPAHERLAERFFATFESALMYDYEMRDGVDGVRLLVGSDTEGAPDT